MEPTPMGSTTFGFDGAIQWLKAGQRVHRAGWNGKGMFLFLVAGGDMSHPHFEGQAHGHIAMKTAQGYAIPWLASQADMLADDWSVMPEEAEAA